MSAPEVITLRSQVRTVADRWADQYRYWDHDAEKVAIGAALRALDPETATPDDVAIIIGNRSWACPTECDGCGEAFDAVVRVGEEPDYRTCVLCIGCVRAALAALEAAP